MSKLDELIQQLYPDGVNMRNMPELLEEFLPWNQEIQKECHSTKFMAKRSNEQPLPKVA